MRAADNGGVQQSRKLYIVNISGAALQQTGILPPADRCSKITRAHKNSFAASMPTHHRSTRKMLWDQKHFPWEGSILRRGRVRQGKSRPQAVEKIDDAVTQLCTQAIKLWRDSRTSGKPSASCWDINNGNDPTTAAPRPVQMWSRHGSWAMMSWLKPAMPRRCQRCSDGAPT
jgi:hypothetical protein